MQNLWPTDSQQDEQLSQNWTGCTKVRGRLCIRAGQSTSPELEGDGAAGRAGRGRAAELEGDCAAGRAGQGWAGQGRARQGRAGQSAPSLSARYFKLYKLHLDTTNQPGKETTHEACIEMRTHFLVCDACSSSGGASVPALGL